MHFPLEEVNASLLCAEDYDFLLNFLPVFGAASLLQNAIEHIKLLVAVLSKHVHILLDVLVGKDAGALVLVADRDVDRSRLAELPCQCLDLLRPGR